MQVFSAEGGTNRGPATVSVTQPEAQTVWFSTALPAGTQVGDYLILSGASGAQGVGLANIQYWDVNSNSGTVGGVTRSNWPGRFATPTINLQGQQITPSVAQRALILAKRAMGNKASNEVMDSAVWYGQPDYLYTQDAQWYERVVTHNDEKGNSAPNIGRKELSNKFLGRDFHESLQFPLGRVELLVMDNWEMGVLKEVELYDFAQGMNIVPVPDIGTSGGTWKTSKMFAYTCHWQLANKAPRHGVYIQNAGTLNA